MLSALPQEANELWKRVEAGASSRRSAVNTPPALPRDTQTAPIIAPLPEGPSLSNTAEGALGAPLDGSESAAFAIEPTQDADDNPGALDEDAAPVEPEPETSEPAETRRRIASKRPSSTGALRLNARPWAEVYVDGKRVGHTPQTHLELTAGRHRITLQNAEFDLRKTFSVEIEPGVTKTRIVDLLSVPAS